MSATTRSKRCCRWRSRPAVRPANTSASADRVRPIIRIWRNGSSTSGSKACRSIRIPWSKRGWRWRHAGSAVIASACVVALRNTVGRASPVTLQIGLDRRIRVTTRNGRDREGEVLADSYVGSRLTTIVWRPDGAWVGRTILILPDALPADYFRQLRVVLRYGRVSAPVASSRGVDGG